MHPVLLGLGLFTACLSILVYNLQHTSSNERIRTVDYPDYYIHTDYFHPSERTEDIVPVSGTDYLYKNWDSKLGFSTPYKDFGQKLSSNQWGIEPVDNDYEEFEYDDFYQII